MSPDVHRQLQEKLERSTERSDGWYSETQTNSRGLPLSNHANVVLALRRAPEWADVFGYDAFREQTVLRRPVPVVECPIGKLFEKPRRWEDSDDLKAQEWLQLSGLCGVGLDIVRNAISQRALELSFHPVRDWLDTLKWDGITRLGGAGNDTIHCSWLTTYLGAENTPYVDAVGRMFLISAVARIFDPGCKADHMLILEGPQGIGKSGAVRILAGNEFFSDCLPNIASKDAMAHLPGLWIIEIAELDAMSRAEDATLKAFLSRQTDRYRPAYGRREVERRRQCVFIGTTNSSGYLRDPTGARRYWPVPVSAVDLAALGRDRDQLWAEAVARYLDGEPWHIVDPNILALARIEQDARNEGDAWEGDVATYVRGKSSVLIMDVLRDGVRIETAKCDTRTQKRVVAILTRLGWQRGRKSSRGIVWLAPEAHGTFYVDF